MPKQTILVGEKCEKDNAELLLTHMDPKERTLYINADLSCKGTNNNSNCGYQQKNLQILSEEETSFKESCVPGNDFSIYSNKKEGK